MWERWNSFTHESGFGNAGMNSFNHYVYGAIGEWMYAGVAGLDLDPNEPGYRHLLFRPCPGGGMTSAEAALQTRYGRAAIRWYLRDDTLVVDCTVPPNAQGTVSLSGQKPVKILSGDHQFSVVAHVD